MQPGRTLPGLTVKGDFSLYMNAAGKSDVFEAVLQLLILSALREHGASQPESLIRNLRLRISGVDFVEEHSLYIALSNLESSGWVRRRTWGPIKRRAEKWELTPSARVRLPQELKQWNAFIDKWPLIARLLQTAVQARIPDIGTLI
jgi:DNA-binding PadR family transcriptional regulator